MGEISALLHTLTRRITVEEHLAAKARLEASSAPLPPSIHHPDGSATIFARLGIVDIEDYTRRDGHIVLFNGNDRYGWPKGHHNSPARLYE